MRRNLRYMIVALIVLIAIIVNWVDWFDEGILYRIELVAKVLAVVAAIMGIFRLKYEFQRERDLTEADFIVKLNLEFISNDKLARIYEMLEKSKKEGQNTNPFTEEDHIIDMANYLSFFGPFYGLLERNILKIETIDILAYRFQLATNNRFMQEMLICEEKKVKAWRNLYLLHKKWSEYRKKRGLPIWQEEHDLLKTDACKKVIKAKTT